MKDKYQITENFKLPEKDRKSGFLKLLSKLISLDLKRSG